MIDEAIGKILGMVMAYAASALGMFVAYVNYRRRIVKAERVMSGAAWTVVLASVLAVAAGALVVVRLAAPPPVEAAAETVPEAVAAAPEPPPAPVAPAVERDERRWPWIGIVVPALVFLFATVVTAALHRHFSTQVTGP